MIRHVLDAILVLVLVEGSALAAYHARTGRGPSPRDLAGNLGAGFFLLLAARIATGEGDLGVATQGSVAVCLLAALVAHVTDLAARWSR